MRVAVLDEKGLMIGAYDAAPGDDATDLINAGDLPADGSYRWDGQTFIPMGHGHGKPTRRTVGSDKAVYLFMRAMIDGTPIPQECADWCTWYERFNG